MSDKKEIKLSIKNKIKQNISKEEIEKELSSKYDSNLVKKILKDYPEPKLKKKYELYNNILIGLIVFTTLFKLLGGATLLAEFGPILILVFSLFSLIIPTFLIIFLLFYRASGYIATALFTIHTLIQILGSSFEVFTSGDIAWIGVFTFQLLITLTIIFLSYYLWRKIYPDYKLFS